MYLDFVEGHNWLDFATRTTFFGLVVHDTEKSETVRKMVFHGALDE